MDPFFFEFVVGPPVEYLLRVREEFVAEDAPAPPPVKPKAKTMWDLPDPFLPKEK